MPRLDRLNLRRAFLIGAAGLLATLSCGRDVTGPNALLLMRGFTFDARFDAPGLADGVAGEIVQFDRVRVVLVNTRGDTVVDRVVDFPSTAEEVSLSLDVPLTSGASPSGETMSLALRYMNAQNDTVFRGGPLPVTVVPSAPGQQPPPAPVIPVTYTGPGSGATSVEIAPGVTTILSGDPFAFVATARDGQGQPLTAPIAWLSADTTRARVTAPAVGSGTTLPGRGAVPIIAQLLTGPADTVVLNILPRAQALLLVSGNNQTAIFNTLLPQPLVVRVNATDGLGMAGVTVDFAVTSGGGSVSAPSVVTDASGLAQVSWTAGFGVGAQTVTATATGLTGSPVTFTATAPSVELLHHYPMTGDLSDAVGGQDGALVGNASVVDGALTLDGFTGYAQLPAHLIPTSGSYSVSLFVRSRTALDAAAAYISQGTAGDAFFVGNAETGVIAVGDDWANTGFVTPPNDALFHHYVVTVDAATNTSRLYVDGTQRAILGQAITSSTLGSGTRLGRQHLVNLEYLEGEIDEVRIYRGAIGAVEVAALHATGTTTPGRLVYGTQPADVAAAAVMAPAVVVRVEDALGRLKADFNGPVTIELTGSPAGVTLGGTLTVNAVSGIATFADLTVDQAGAGFSLTATAAGTISAVSGTFDVTGGAGGGVNEWIAAGGVWSNAGSWSLGRVPVPTDTVRLNAVGTYTVVLAENVTVARLEIGGPGGRNASLSVDGAYTLTTTEGVLVNGAGILSLELGAVVLGAAVQNDGLIRSNGGSIAADLAHNGSLMVRGVTVVSGAVTTTAVSAIDVEANAGAGDIGVSFANGFTNNGDILLTSTGGVFDAGLAFSAGVLTNAVGGTITFAAGTGGDRTFFGRLVNLGTITVSTPSSWVLNDGANSNGGSLNVNAQLSLGVVGTTPTFTNSDAIVIASGQVLGLTSGTMVQVNGALLTGGGTLAVTPAAALRLLDGSVLAGVANSGVVEASGVSAFSGPFSMNTGSTLRVAGFGPATGPTTLTLASGFTNSGTIELTNLADAPRVLNATLALSAGTLTNATGGTIRTLAGNGGGTRAITGPVLNQGLIDIAPGAAGVLSIGGAFNTSTGTVAMDVGGLTPGTQHDQLLVSGTATLGGTLNAGLFGGYVPTPGSSFTMVSAGTVTGTFGTVNATAPLLATPTYAPTTVTLLGPVALTANNWTNVAGGNWSTPGNWSLGRAPIAGDTVVIAAAGTYTVTLDVNAIADVIFVGGGAGAQTLAVGTRTLTVDTALVVQPTGTMTVGTGVVNGAGAVVNNGTLVHGGTFGADLTNFGLMIARDVSFVNGAFTNGAGGTLRVLGQTTTGAADVTIANGFTNAGALELTAQDAGYIVHLTVNGGPLLNVAGATILNPTGSGGTRVLTAELVNEGTVQLSMPLTINGASAAHLNSGTIDLAAGDLTITQSGTAPSFTNTGTVVMNGRTLTFGGGTVDLTGGQLSGNLGRLVTTGTPTVRFTTATVRPRVTFSAGTVLPDPFTIPVGDSLRVLGGTFAPPSLTNDGTLILEGTSTVTSAVTTGAGSLIRVRGSAVGGAPTATFTNALTNAATLDLVTENAGYTVALNAPSIVNTATGVINSLPGAGGTRTIAAALDNAGTLNVTFALTIALADAAHLNSGTIALTGADLVVAQSGTAPSFTNTGTIATNGRTLTVSNGALDLTAGLVAGYAGRLVTTGTPTVQFSTATVQPYVTFSAGTVLPDPFTIPVGDSLRVLGGTFAPPSLTNDGELSLLGTATVTSAVTTGTGSVLRIRGASVGGAPTVTFTNPLTNTATLDLVTENAGYTVVLNAPSLVNTATGVVNSLPGAGGTRTIAAALANAGTLNVTYPLTVAVADAAHLNSGTIALTGADLVVAQSGTAPSFTNTGTIATNGRTVTVNNGNLDLSAGLLSGYTGRLVTTGTPTVRFTTATVQPRVTFSAGTILPDPFTVPVNDSLRVNGGTFAPPTLTNDGLLLLEGTLTLNSAVTTTTGSTIRVRGTGVTGAPTVTFTNPLTNTATIELTNEDAGYAVVLAAPSLTNTSSGVINSLPAAGGTRTIAAALTNAGTVNVPYPLSLNAPSAAHLNSGTITLTGADLGITQTGTTPSFTNTGTIATNGRTVTVSNGNLDLSAGLLSGYTGRLITTGTPTVRFTTATVQPRVTFSAGTILPDPFTVPVNDSLRVNGGTFAPPTLTNDGLLLLEGTLTLNSAVTTTTGSTIRVRGTGVTGAPTVTFTNPLTNTATIELTNEDAGYAVVLAAPSLTNTGTGVIHSLPAAGGTRTIAAALANAGTVNVPYPLSLNAPSAAHLNSGTITLTGADLGITQTGTTPSFTNTGTIATNGRTMTVSNGLLDLSAGLVSGYTGFLVTTGSPTMLFSTATVQPRVNISSGTVLPDPFIIPAGDSLRVRGGVFAPPSLTNEGSLFIEGFAIVDTDVTTSPGSLIRVRGVGVSGAATATFVNPLTNAATLDLTTENAGYAVILEAPSLQNASSGVINALPGAGGSRTIAAALTNDGAVNVSSTLSIDEPSAAHVNSGTITLTTGDLTVAQSGTSPSFTNLGTVATGTRTFSVAGGTLDLSAGLVSGYNGFLTTTGSPVVSFTSATVQPRLTLSAGTSFPAPLTVAVGDSLRFRGGNWSASSTTVDGTLVLEGTTSIAGAIDVNAGGLVLVRGSAAGGGAASATLFNGLTNAGTLRLTAQDAGYTVALSLGATTLTNAAGGLIDFGAALGSRTLSAGQIENLGTFDANYTALVTGPLAQRGTMTVAATRTLTLQSLLSLHAGSSTTVIGTLVKNGGCTQLGGSIGGGGAGATCP